MIINLAEFIIGTFTRKSPLETNINKWDANHSEFSQRSLHTIEEKMILGMITIVVQVSEGEVVVNIQNYRYFGGSLRIDVNSTKLCCNLLLYIKYVWNINTSHFLHVRLSL